MEDQTSVINKADATTVDAEDPQPRDSKIGNVSVRSLIALTLVLTVCIMCIAYVACDVAISMITKTLPTFDIKEPLYSGFMVAIGAYLGKSLSQKAKN